MSVATTFGIPPRGEFQRLVLPCDPDVQSVEQDGRCAFALPLLKMLKMRREKKIHMRWTALPAQNQVSKKENPEVSNHFRCVIEDTEEDILEDQDNMHNNKQY